MTIFPVQSSQAGGHNATNNKAAAARIKPTGRPTEPADPAGFDTFRECLI
jgi:hypothetical protein